MATKRVLADKDFNRIIVRTHRLARNITMRVKPDGLHVTVPPYSLSSKVMEVVEQYRERLFAGLAEGMQEIYRLGFPYSGPLFSDYGWKKAILPVFLCGIRRKE